MANFRPGYLEQGNPLGMTTLDVSLVADNTVIDVSGTANTPAYGLVKITSDNTTATNRTFTLTNGGPLGQMIVLTLVSAASTTADLQDTGNVALSAAWQPLQNDTLTLVWQGSTWIELARADN